MNIVDQTPEMKEHLYKLTLQFVRKYQPRYYRQYQGDLNDLASEFFCQFLTPKSRSGEKQTLLDKYNPELCPKSMSRDTFFANLVKVSVQRMLIDRSRQDPIKVESIDSLIETYGDSISKTFDFTDFADESIDDLDIELMYTRISSKFSKLTPAQVVSLKSYYTEVRNVVTPSFRTVFDRLFNPVLNVDTTIGPLPLYSLTPKTACILYKGQVVDVDRFTGTPRKPLPFSITPSGLSYLHALRVYKSSYSRSEFPFAIEALV